MDYVIRQVFTGSTLTAKAIAVNNLFKCIVRRTFAVTAFMICTYGLLAAEVELAKLEGFPAAVIR